MHCQPTASVTNVSTPYVIQHLGIQCKKQPVYKQATYHLRNDVLGHDYDHVAIEGNVIRHTAFYPEDSANEQFKCGESDETTPEAFQQFEEAKQGEEIHYTCTDCQTKKPTPNLL